MSARQLQDGVIANGLVATLRMPPKVINGNLAWAQGVGRSAQCRDELQLAESCVYPTGAIHRRSSRSAAHHNISGCIPTEACVRPLAAHAACCRWTA